MPTADGSWENITIIINPPFPHSFAHFLQFPSPDGNSLKSLINSLGFLEIPRKFSGISRNPHFLEIPIAKKLGISWNCWEIPCDFWKFLEIPQGFLEIARNPKGISQRFRRNFKKFPYSWKFSEILRNSSRGGRHISRTQLITQWNRWRSTVPLRYQPARQGPSPAPFSIFRSPRGQNLVIFHFKIKN